MVLLAFSLQDQVEKYGAYVGIAAFFGLAVLTLLYFAQAREVKRLREWAGRAPERAAELELAVAEHAEEARRAAPAPQPQVVAQPQAQRVAAVAATNGAVKLKPAEVAALAFARAAGVHEPHEPHPPLVPAATAAVAAPPTQVAAAGAAVATGEPAAAQALNGGGGPGPATPAARRADPLGGRGPLPPRRTSAPPRRAPAPPPRRESNARAVVLTAIAGVLILAACVFVLTQVLGGDDPTTPAPPNKVETPTPDAQTSAAPTTTTTPAPTKDNVLVGVYNGTGQTGLAASFQGNLIEEGYPKDHLGADTAPAANQRQTSVVMYRRGAKAAAQQVADVLGITDVKQIDAATQSLIANAPKRWDVVAIIGADKTN
jgi:LytR cell envelope-related transcriptional attenuator